MPKPFTSVNCNTGNGKTQYSKPGSTQNNNTFTMKDAFEERGILNKNEYTYPSF